MSCFTLGVLFIVVMSLSARKLGRTAGNHPEITKEIAKGIFGAIFKRR